MQEHRDPVVALARSHAREVAQIHAIHHEQFVEAREIFRGHLTRTVLRKIVATRERACA